MSFIVFRVDSSNRIGIGHLMRCMTLANILSKNGSKILFLSRKHCGNSNYLISENNYELNELLPPRFNIETETNDNNWLGCSVKEDVDECSSILQAYPKPDLLIIDHYSIDTKWESNFKDKAKKIMVLDDLANREHNCDLLLDQTFGRIKKDYTNLTQKNCIHLLGENYILLRDEFTKLKHQIRTIRSKTKIISNVLISLGGTDPDNITTQVINWLILIHDEKPTFNVTVILNYQSIYRESIERLIKPYSWIKLIFNSKSISQLMLSSQLAIGSSGASAWERCYMGLPTLSIQSANNQKNVSQALSSSKAIIDLGDFKDITFHEFKNQFDRIYHSKELYFETMKASFLCCDGLGVNRVESSINKLLFPKVRLKRATEDDLLSTFEWQSNSKVRQFLRNPNPVLFEEHQSWFYDTLKNPKRFLYIAYFNDIKVGSLRLDELNDKQLEISIIISPDYQGMNLAVQTLNLIPKKFKKYELIANVHSDNFASHKLFNKAGFKKINDNLYKLLNHE